MASIKIQSSKLDNLVVGDLNVKWSARGDRILRYYVDIKHNKLNLHKEVSAPEIFILQRKLDTLVSAWDAKFEGFKRQENIVAGHATAENLSRDAEARLQDLKSILYHTLQVDDKVDWDSLKSYKEYNYPKIFSKKKPARKVNNKPNILPLKLPHYDFPENMPDYEAPKVGFVDRILGRSAGVIAEHDQRYEEELKAWREREEAHRSEFEAENRAKTDAHEARYQTRLRDWEALEQKNEAEHALALAEWETQKKRFWDRHNAKKAEHDAQLAAEHARVDQLIGNLARGDEGAVEEHASLVLDASDYNGLFEKSYLLQYQSETRLLKIAYDLPGIDALPKLKSVKFIKNTGELKEYFISERENKLNFDLVSYQICLRTIHEIFEADESLNVDSILFNGFVNFIDPTDGVEKRSCLLSVLVDRKTFSAIDLSRVDPKACFKSLKGVSAASLASMTSIPPVMEMDTEDRRFIEGREIGASVRQGTNLAAISWDDFEHLVREVFEREFASRGGEVKITQSSRDGGVDAVAFDPDPITGGKIVIQAKRYTRTVGVSAVRDLYGTLMNEGASRGILVTTADYGPDAYHFANGKPLTLMNGANLLHLMKVHGYDAKIDLREARADLYGT